VANDKCDHCINPKRNPEKRAASSELVRDQNDTASADNKNAQGDEQHARKQALFSHKN
jgi:hypothetical protein